jgi:hypothetical protein
MCSLLKLMSTFLLVIMQANSEVIGFLKEILNPEGFGYSVTSEVRKEAKHILDKLQPVNMSNDFEVHPIGTSDELRLSRELVSEIRKSSDLLGETFPISIKQAYNRLYGQYIRQKQSEEYP